MHKSKRRLPNALQNALILLLLASALFLVLRTGLIRTDALDGMFAAPSAGAPQSTEALTGAPQPIHIAARTGGACSAWLNETTGGNVFEDFAPPLAEALASAANSTAVDETEFRRALENDSIYYDFTTSLPLSLLSRVLGSSMAENSSLSARVLLLSSLQDATAALYAWDPEQNAYCRWDTGVPSDSLSETAQRHSGSAAEFAFLLDAPYSALSPYTLLYTGAAETPNNLTAKGAAEDEVNELLTALEFNVHSNTRYPESNGTEVIVQGTHTLRLAPDGTASYSGGTDIPALLRVEYAGESATLSECADAAWHVASTLLASRIGDATLYLRAAESDGDGSAKIEFGYLLDGYPILFPEDCAVKMQIENNAITAFTLHLRAYTRSDAADALLPVLQAAAAAQGADAPELFRGYYDDGSDTLPPRWLRR